MKPCACAKQSGAGPRAPYRSASDRVSVSAKLRPTAAQLRLSVSVETSAPSILIGPTSQQRQLSSKCRFYRKVEQAAGEVCLDSIDFVVVPPPTLRTRRIRKFFFSTAIQFWVFPQQQ